MVNDCKHFTSAGMAGTKIKQEVFKLKLNNRDVFIEMFVKEFFDEKEFDDMHALQVHAGEPDSWVSAR